MTRILLAALLACPVITASAAPFGNTQVGQSNTIAPCTADVVVVSLPLQVGVSSRLLTTLGGSTVSADNSNVYAVSYEAILRNAANASVAQSQSHSVVAGEYLTSMSDSEILFGNGTNAPATLGPGDYVLELHVETSGSCSGYGTYLQTPTLTYVLLSSVFDRIFADSFS